MAAIQWLIAPFFMAHWSEGIFGAAGYTFMSGVSPGRAGTTRQGLLVR